MASRGRPKGAKDRKPRRQRGELIKCFSCPPTHEGWLKRDIRRRRGVDYCPEHLPPAPTKWPSCPKCQASDFGRFVWKGSVFKTTVTCESCGFKDLAINHFDAVTIQTIASPLEDGR